jgi:hypothetical protein
LTDDQELTHQKYVLKNILGMKVQLVLSETLLPKVCCMHACKHLWDFVGSKFGVLFYMETVVGHWCKQEHLGSSQQ